MKIFGWIMQILIAPIVAAWMFLRKTEHFIRWIFREIFQRN